jgi:hypothetical protein
MDWNAVDSQADLDALGTSVCWEDSESIEYYALTGNEPYYPSDVSRSGYRHKNVHVLCRICSPKAAYLELVFIDCDRFSSYFLDNPHIRGYVDSLKRVEILDHRNDFDMRCSRLIYRFLDEKDVSLLHDGEKSRVRFSTTEPAEE